MQGLVRLTMTSRARAYVVIAAEGHHACGTATVSGMTLEQQVLGQRRPEVERNLDWLIRSTMVILEV